MTRLIFDTLSLLFFGLLLGAWLHARFGKPTVEGRWWDFALGLVILDETVTVVRGGLEGDPVTAMRRQE
jgi:hypothetical protein